MIKYKKLVHLFFGIFYGIALHDFAHQVYQLKGTVFSLEGGYIGFIGLLIVYIIGNLGIIKCPLEDKKYINYSDNT